MAAADGDAAGARPALAHLQALLRLAPLARAAVGTQAARPALDLAALLRDAPPELEVQPDD